MLDKWISHQVGNDRLILCFYWIPRQAGDDRWGKMPEDDRLILCVLGIRISCFYWIPRQAGDDRWGKIPEDDGEGKQTLKRKIKGFLSGKSA